MDLIFAPPGSRDLYKDGEKSYILQRNLAWFAGTSPSVLRLSRIPLISQRGAGNVPKTTPNVCSDAVWSGRVGAR